MTTRRSTRLAALVAAGVLAAGLLGACGGDDDDDAGGGASGSDALEITDVWARTSPMEAKNGAVYMTIDNTGDADDALVDASVDESVAASVELHETVAAETGTEDSMGGGETEGSMTEGSMGEGEGSMGATMTMREVDQIDLPAGETTELKPGGYHVMLLDLAEPLEVDSTFQVTLQTESGTTIELEAEVRE